MADDYLARLGIDTGDMRAAITQTISLLGQLEDHFGSKVATAVAKATAALEKAGGAQRDVQQGAKDTAAALGDEESAFDGLLAKLNAAKTAYAEFRQQALTGEGGGKSIAAYTSDQLKELVAISDAATANFVGDARKRLTAESEATAAVQREVDARSRAYAAEFEAMSKLDTANRVGGRVGQADWSNVGLGTANQRNTAARNTSSVRGVSGTQQFQQEYASQQTLTSMASYYSELERSSAATEHLTKASNASSTSLPRLRYAMYDVSIFAGTLGTALAAGGVAVERTAIQYEAAFASVARTAHTTGTSVAQDAQLRTLRNDLVDLSTQVPVTYADITKIATLGNQLNIPAADLTNFTKTVAEFSASTDVSVDASATAFGRLGQVFKDTNYKGIGDEIAYLGVNAVATESQIIKVSQQIAVSGQAYGFTEKQTLALATAYASLGIQAESARGTTVRSFSEISLAVANGGAKLDELAKVSGMSTAAFKKQWQTDASGAFTAFVSGLASYGGNAKQVLADLGITASRDTTNLLLLAQNSNVLTKAQKDVTEAGGALDRMFQHQTDTVAARLTLAQNNVNALFADIGQSTDGPVRGALDLLNNLLTIIDHLARDPLAAGGLAITVGITTLVGALLLGVAAWTQFRANLLAVATIQEALGPNTTGLAGMYQILFGSLTRNTAATEALTVADEGLATAQAGVAESGAAEGLAETGAAAAKAEGAMAGAAGTGGRLAGILGKAGIVGSVLAIVAVAPSLISALSDWGDQMSGTQKDADSLAKTILGLNDAKAKKGSQSALATASDYITSSTSYSTGGSYVAGPGGSQMYVSGPRASVSNARLVYNQRTTGQNTPGQSIGFQQGGAAINKNQQEASDQFNSWDAALTQLVQGGHLKEAQAGFDTLTSHMKAQDTTAKMLAVLYPQLSSALGVTTGKTIQGALATKTAAGDTKNLQSAYSQIISTAFGVGASQTAVQKSLSALGKSFVTNGIQSTIYGGSLQKVISDILAEAGSGPAAASQMETLFQTLVKGGYASAAQLKPLQEVILALNGGSKATAAAVPGLDSLATGYNAAAAAANKQAAAAAKSAAATEPAVRTLMDYGNDLSSVFGNMLEYQFGAQTALDNVTSKWDSLRQRERDATDQIKQYKAQLATLQQDKADDQFYLGIANRYNDQQRAGDLRADIASKNAQIADTQKSLNKAQTDGSKALKGNSQAAIQNRSDLYGLIDGYKDYIAKLGESGASQSSINDAIAKSKQQFIDQATQMGFNKRDVGDLATTFDGFSRILRGIPRNVNTGVTANTSAAMKALKDYDAAASRLKNKTYGGGTYIAPKATAPSRQSKLAAEASSLMGDIAAISAALAAPDRPKNSYVLSQMANQLSDYRSKLANLAGYSGGGYTGDLPTNQVAGFVHGREYVLNATGQSMFPREMLDAANQGRAPYMTTMRAPKMMMPQNMTVSLSQLDRMLLGANPTVNVGISPNAFGSAIDAAFVRAGQLGSN